MIDIKNIIINLVNNTALVQVYSELVDNFKELTIVLDSISPDNFQKARSIAEALDWSNTQPGKAYHLESGVLTETPVSPGPTYKFDYKTNAWQDTRSPEETWKEVRLNRDVLLKASDWTQLPDVSITTKEAWATYRQALRDITNQSDPYNIVWPTAPGA